MSNYYLDTSALAKRYLTETGSLWIRTLVDPMAGNVIIASDLSGVEFFSTLARRERAGELTPANVYILQSRFLADFEREYVSVSLESAVLRRARNLVNLYPLRSLDALQLASAIEAVNVLGEPMTFVRADKHLLTAAANDGFNIENPNSQH